MRCQHCRREIGTGEPVYRLSLLRGHPWAVEGPFGDVVVRYVCADCNDPTKNQWLQGRHWGEPTPCRNCGRSVIHDTVRKAPKHIVCGPDCRRAVYTAQARAHYRKNQQHCQTCGKLFQPTRADAQFCSSPCRQRAYRQRPHAAAT